MMNRFSDAKREEASRLAEQDIMPKLEGANDFEVKAAALWFSLKKLYIENYSTTDIAAQNLLSDANRVQEITSLEF